MKKNHDAFTLEHVSIRLVKEAPLLSEKPILMPMDAVALVGNTLSEMDRELMCIINLKSNGKPINCSFVSMGTLNASLTHPREMIKSSILSNASRMIMVHNHPSGSLKPSAEDVKITDMMIQVCNLLQIPLLDHIIVSPDFHLTQQYFSFREKEIMNMDQPDFTTDFRKIEFPEPKEEKQKKKHKKKKAACL